MRLIFTRVSQNSKTGPIPTTIGQASTCPVVCPLKGNGCYAESGPLAMHWKRAGISGMDFQDFLKEIPRLPRGQLWRWGVAGDLPGNARKIAVDMLRALVGANKGRAGFAYTHHAVLDEQDGENAPVNREAIKEANANGFTVNLSANNLEHADKLKALNVGPVVTILPTDSTRNHKTPGGNQVIICPATYRDNVSCATCQLCQKVDRKCIVGFPAHGARKKVASAVSLAS